jgi:hypothetical protein
MHLKFNLFTNQGFESAELTHCLVLEGEIVNHEVGLVVEECSTAREQQAQSRIVMRTRRPINSMNPRAQIIRIVRSFRFGQTRGLTKPRSIY